jgi:dienelactone hydrolase
MPIRHLLCETTGRLPPLAKTMRENPLSRQEATCLRNESSRKALALLVLLPFLVGPEARADIRRPIHFKSADGTDLSGTFYDSRAVGPAALFLLDCEGQAPELVNLAGKITAAGPRVLLWDYRKDGNPKASLEKATEDANAAWQWLTHQARVGTDVIGIVAIGCGARIAIPFAAKTGKVKVMVLISPDLEGVTDEQVAAVANVALQIYANGDETGAQRLFAANHNDKTQLKLYRRTEKAMSLYRADRWLRDGIDTYFQNVYGAFSADDF